jgi:2-dehydro-3-deoxygluconokinase
MVPADLPAGLVARGRFLHVSGISLAIGDGARALVDMAIAQARQAAARVAFDPNVRLSLWPVERARAVIEATVRRCDLFLPSLDDMRLLFGLTDPAAIAAFALDRGAGLVLLKAGRDGAWLADRDGLRRVPGFAVAAVDATGAGDCCDGAFLARLARGDAPDRAARYACAAAALTTTGFGAVAPIPEPAAVAALLAG